MGGNMVGDGAKVIDILLVEDNPGDARLLRETIRDAKIRNRVFHVVDGVEAMDFLKREGEHGDVPVPDVILLDLNLPRKNGREVLAEIKSDAGLRRIPVVIITTSDHDDDVVETYDLSPDCYIKKPVDVNRFMRVIQSMERG